MQEIDFKLLIRPWALGSCVSNELEFSGPNMYAAFDFRPNNLYLQYFKNGEWFENDGQIHRWEHGSSVNDKGALKSTILLDGKRWEVASMSEKEMELRSGGMRCFYKPAQITISISIYE